MKLRLPVDLYSLDQLSMVILELDDYIGLLRDIEVRTKANKPKGEAPHMSALLMGLFNGTNVQINDKKGADELLKSLKKVRDEAPVIHVTLADIPNRILKRQLTVWFRTQIHQYALISFAMRRDIGGGLILRAGSYVYNLSLKHLLVENKHRIAEIFESVR